jgi:hypothetical protein
MLKSTMQLVTVNDLSFHTSHVLFFFLIVLFYLAVSRGFYL